jgi:hypothetical protein
VLQFQAPETTLTRRRRVFRIQEATYHLCAVVYLSQNGSPSEHIRTYWKDGTDIVPAEIDDYQNKEPHIANAQQWTIQDKGEYMLFYYRVVHQKVDQTLR